MNKGFYFYAPIIIFKLFILSLMSSCSYEHTVIEESSLFNPTWDYSSSSKLTFNENYVEIKNGQAQLKPIDLNFDSSELNSLSQPGMSLNQNFVSIQYDKNSSEHDVRQILPQQAGQLLAYWRFDSGVIDSQNLSRPMDTFADAANSLVSHLGSHSLALDGTLDNISTTSVSDLASDKVKTISAWVKKMGDSSGTYGYITRKGFSYNNDSIYIRVENGEPAGVRCSMAQPSVPGELTVTKLSLQNDVWYHLACVIDSDNELKLYINGTLVAQDSYTELPAITTAPFVIGAVGANGVFSFNGFIDELAIFDVPLTAQEVKLLYNQQSLKMNDHRPEWSPRYNSIVGHWTMDGHWHDSSGNENHLTISGDSTFVNEAKVGGLSGTFDGIGDTVLDTSISGSLSALDLNSDMTVSLWLKPALIQSEIGLDHNILGTVTAASPAYLARFFYFNQTAASPGTLWFARYNGTTSASVVGTTPINDGSFHHIVAVAKSGQLFMYIDGKLTGTGTDVSSIPGGVTALNFTSGAIASFEGELDDFVIWEEALSPSEVSLIFHRQKQKYVSHIDSEVISLGSTSSQWPDLSWSTTLPFGKGLVGDFDTDGIADSESSLDYSNINESLAAGLIGYWSLNENIGTTGASSVIDTSGNNAHGTPVGSVVFGQDGHFLNSARFDGISSHIAFNDSALDISGSGQFTQALWVFSEVNDINYHSILGYNLDGISQRPPTIYINNENTISAYFGHGTGQCGVVKTNAISSGRWTYIVTSFDGTLFKIYIDGVEVASSSSCSSFTPVSQNNLWVGGSDNFFPGKIDEFSFWSRALSVNEVQQLYRRGANRVKLQVKSCIDSNCQCKSYSSSPEGNANDCDGDTIVNAVDFEDSHKAIFIGPGGDGTTYYSEAFHRKGTDTLFNCGNNTSDSNGNICVNDEITLSAGPKPTVPVINFDNLPLSARPNANPFFKYRVYLEADENLACSGSPCFPELTSVNLNTSEQEKYFGGIQEVKPTEVINYSRLISIAAAADDCVSFQLSPDGSNYFYYSEGAWVPATQPEHRSTKGDLENNILKYSEQFAPGALHIKSFLKTNSQQTSNCSIRNIDVNYVKK